MMIKVKTRVKIRAIKMFDKYRKDGSDKVLKKQFGIGIDDYLQMFTTQGGRCACCDEFERNRTPKGKVKSLCVDHDHRTGKVRKLLCNDCNRIIGIAEQFRNVGQVIALFKAATNYLVLHGK
jgi:hypothetical protein